MAELIRDFREVNFPRLLEPDNTPVKPRDPWQVTECLPPFSKYDLNIVEMTKETAVDLLTSASALAGWAHGIAPLAEARRIANG